MKARFDRKRWIRIADLAIHGLGRVLAVTVGMTLIVVASAIVLLSQTVVGRRLAQEYAERALSGPIHGEVNIGPIIGGNLISRIHLAHLSVIGHDGKPFVTADSVRVEINPLSFFLGSFRIRNVEAQRLTVNLQQDPGGSWNFQRLFGSQQGEAADSAELLTPEQVGTTRVLISDLRVHNGRIRVRTPWDSPAVRRRRGAGETIWRVLQTGPGRWERVIELDSLSGRFPLVRLVDPVRPMRYELRGIQAVARAVTQDLRVKRFDGSATFRDTIAIEIDELSFERSRVVGNGWVVAGSPTQFNFDVEARPFAFEELQWLPVPIPTSGGGPADIGLSTRGPTVVVDVSSGDARVDDSRVTGGFRLWLESPPRLQSMDLSLRPLRVALVDEILGREPIVDGTMRGTVRGAGPLTLLQVDADLEVSDVEGDTPPSHVHVTGGLSVGEPHRLEGLAVDFEAFEPRWSGVIGLPATLGGRLTGTSVFDGVSGSRIEFRSDVEYRTSAATVSRLSGGGTLDLEGDAAVNVQLDAAPLSLSVVDPYVPGLDLVGDVRGPISVAGPMSDLRIAADLRTPRGLLNFDGRFDVQSAERTYDATLLARDVQLHQWARGFPSTRLALAGRVQGVGTDPKTLRARFDLEILPSQFAGARVDSSLLRFTMEDGLARVDTFAIRTDVGSVDGFGLFGLTEDRSGSLVLDVTAPDLSTWNRWLVPGRIVQPEDTSVVELFEEFEAVAEDAAEGPLGTPEAVTRDTLSGALTARGVLFGNATDYSFGGRVIGQGTHYGGFGADSIRMTVDIADPTVLDTLVVRTHAWNAETPQGGMDSLFVRWQRIGPADSDLELYGRRDTTAELSAHARLRWTDELWRIDADRFDLVAGSERFELAAPTRLQLGDDGLVVRDMRLLGSAGGVVGAHGTLPASGSGDLSMTFRNLRLQDLLRVGEDQPAFEGSIDADLRMRGTVDRPLMNLHFEVTDPGLAGVRYPLFGGDVSYADREIELNVRLRDGERILGRADGTLRADLSLRPRERRWLDDPVNVRVVVDSIPIRPIELAFESLEDVSGHARGELTIGGEPGRFDYRGLLRFDGVESTLPALGIRVREISGDVAFEGSTARLDSVSFVSSAGGHGFASGAVGLSSITNPEFDLDLGVRRLRGIDRRQMSMEFDGTGHLGGTYRHPELSGDFRVSEGEIRGDYFLRQRQVVDLRDPEVFALIDTATVGERNLLRRAQNPFLQEIRLDVTLTMGPSFWVRSREYEVELAGDVDVLMQRSSDLLEASGVLHLTRGKYQYFAGRGEDLTSLYSRQLQISGGTVTFVRTPGLDPNLAIRAEHQTRSEVGPLTIFLDIGGTSRNPNLLLSSEPPLPESDLLCLLLFSSSCVGVTTEGGLAGSLVREGLLGTLGSQFSQVLVGDIGLVDFVDLRSTGVTGTGTGDSTTDPLFVGTEVEVGRYVARDLFVRVRQPLGGQLPSATLEWSFHPGWLLKAKAEDRFQRLGLLSSVSNVDTKRSYGLFLQREWSF